MKNIILVLSAMASIFFSSCKKGEGKHDLPNQETTVVATQPGTKPQEETIPLTLNDGQKWYADVETTRSIAIMQGLLREFPSSATEEDYRALHKKLITRYQSIVQKCTMEGDARIQLNNYLIPLKKMIDATGTRDLETYNNTFSEMKAYLMKYSHYFL